MKIKRNKTSFFISVIFLMLFASNVFAEDSESIIRGTVVAATGEPVIGASIIQKGTTNGIFTGLDGDFTLKLIEEENTVLEVSFIGYVSQDIVVGTQSEFNIILESSDFAINEVVVTALGIKRSEKALSYNVQQINSESIVGNKGANFIGSLNGKVAGLVVNTSSSGVGGAAKVVMRGQKSILQSSNAMYVIDGIPMFSSAGTGGTEFGSRGNTEPIADINPEDIESISVLNGAAAAALYGSDAANGVIAITTRKGSAGKATVTVSSNIDISNPLITPQFQNTYGTGNVSSSTPSPNLSWGAKMNQYNNYGYDPASDYFQTGVTATENVSFSTGNEKNQLYMSAGAVTSEGIVPNNTYDRYNFNMRATTSLLDDKMTIDVNASYIMQSDRNMTNQGTYSNPLVGAYLFPRGNDWNDIKMYERYDPIRKINTQYWPVGDAGMAMQNPYWINSRNLRENDRKRYMIGASVNYKVLDWLSVSGRVRIDNANNDYTEKLYATTNTQLTEGSNNGLYALERSKDQQTYADVLLNINKYFGDDFSLNANIGASISDVRSDNSTFRGPIADGSSAFAGERPVLPNFFASQNLSKTQTELMQMGWREQNQSIFASAELGYKSTYYLTATIRNDWPSQLAGPRSNVTSYSYPSVGFSAVLTEIIDMPEFIDYAKLRGSFASVGVAFERFLANPRYEWNGSSWSNTTQYPIANLRPERTNSYEIGLTLKLLKKFDIDLSLYHAETTDQTFNPELPVSGWSKIYLQSGSIVNKGIELSATYSNKWGAFGWSSTYNLSMNDNEITSLAKNAMNPITGELISMSQLNVGGLGEARFLLREGGSLGDLYSLIDLRRDENGQVFVDQDGNIATQQIKDPNNYIKLGSVLPDANMSWSNSFNWKNFSAAATITARIGGVVFSRTQAMLDYNGVSEASAVTRDAGSVQVSPYDVITPQNWYSVVAGGTSVPQCYTYSATNVRLQEASIGYTIPRKLLRNIADITVSVVGRNLFMIYNKAPFDPEAVATTGNFYQGVDYFMMPSLRNIGFSVRLKF